jgi:hypothetical protein
MRENSVKPRAPRFCADSSIAESMLASEADRLSRMKGK